MKLSLYSTSFKLKILIVIFLTLFDTILVASFGMGDMISWIIYTKAAIGRNILAAHIAGYQLYPLLATVIFSVFGNLWQMVTNGNAEWYLAIKISILFFYVLTALLLYRYSQIVGKKPLSKLNYLLIFLSTFSILVNTQGLAYVDIYTIPSLITSLIFLYQKKYFWAGLLLGITVSIKFEPILLIPLFGITIFDYREPLVNAIKKSVRFLLGLGPVIIVPWVLLWLYPGGRLMIAKQASMLFTASFLSGQALNVNWILTYILHLVKPAWYLPLGPGGLNTYIGGDGILWPRYIFYLVAALIIFKYWFRQKKNLTNMLTAAILLYFSHFMINRGAHEQHFFYILILTLALYLYNRTKKNLSFLVLTDIMGLVNLILFYGFTGVTFFNRIYFGLDITLVFAAYYIIIYICILWNYLKYGEI